MDDNTNPQASSGDDEVMNALDNFIAGWNSRDVRQYATALHFPHLFLEGGRYRVYPDLNAFIAFGAAHWATTPSEWDHSVWLNRRIVQRIGDTAHVTGTWARIDKVGKTIHTADVLYVVLKRSGQWKIFARSGSRRIGLVK